MVNIYQLAQQQIERWTQQFGESKIFVEGQIQGVTQFLELVSVEMERARVALDPEVSTESNEDKVGTDGPQ